MTAASNAMTGTREILTSDRHSHVPGTALALLACVLVLLPGRAHGEPAAISAEARAVFEQAKDKLLQIRVIHKATRARNSTGTGFIATPDGLVLTNYHVVSKLALEPASYELELERTDGSSGTPGSLPSTSRTTWPCCRPATPGNASSRSSGRRSPRETGGSRWGTRWILV